MPFYKFLDKEHAPGMVEQGILKLSSIDYYRKLEITHKNRWIGDQNENTSNYTTDPITGNSSQIKPEDLNANQLALMKLMFGGNVPKNVNLRLAPKVYYVGQNHHIWCFSEGEFNKLLEGMRFSSMPENMHYNRAVEILDVETLIDQFVMAEVINPRGLNMREHAKSVGFCPIKYVSEKKMVGPEGYTASPCEKDEFFKSQSECRLIINPPDLKIPETVFIKIPDPKSVFRLAYSK